MGKLPIFPSLITQFNWLIQLHFYNEFSTEFQMRNNLVTMLFARVIVISPKHVVDILRNSLLTQIFWASEFTEWSSMARSPRFSRATSWKNSLSDGPIIPYSEVCWALAFSSASTSVSSARSRTTPPSTYSVARPCPFFRLAWVW